MSNKLFTDLKTDEEKSAFFLSGRGYETGVIAPAIQNDVAMAYHRCSEYAKERATTIQIPLAEYEKLKADAERYRVLRMYELRGSWPFDRQGISAPSGLIAFSSTVRGAVTQKYLDDILDDMLGRTPKSGVREDYQQWRAECTRKSIDAAIKQKGGA